MDDPLERVTNLLTLLLESRGALTLQQIADQLSRWYHGTPTAVRAAFERDKALLRDIGVPIETQVLGGDQAGQTAYRLDRARFELRGLELDDDERHALQTAVAAVRSQLGQDALWKLGGAAAGPAPVRAELPALPALAVLRTACSQHHPVEIDYHGTRRRVDPYGLLLRNGFWYVIGFDHVRGEQRTFRVDRIDGDVTLLSGEGFDRPPGFDPATAFPDDPKALGDQQAVATVAVDAELAPAVVRQVGDAAVVARHADGSVELSVPCANVDAFRAWVLALGVHGEVLAPAELRASFVAWLRAIADGPAA